MIEAKVSGYEVEMKEGYVKVVKKKKILGYSLFLIKAAMDE